MQKLEVASPGLETPAPCSASQELNQSTAASPQLNNALPSHLIDNFKTYSNILIYIHLFQDIFKRIDICRNFNSVIILVH